MADLTIRIGTGDDADRLLASGHAEGSLIVAVNGDDPVGSMVWTHEGDSAVVGSLDVATVSRSRCSTSISCRRADASSTSRRSYECACRWTTTTTP